MRELLKSFWICYCPLFLCLSASGGEPQSVNYSFQFEFTSLQVFPQNNNLLETLDSSEQMKRVFASKQVLPCVEQLFNLDNTQDCITYDFRLTDRIMLREALNSEQTREHQIKRLVGNVEAELDVLYSAGFVDGTGLLYQSTSSYLDLMKICTENELVDVHNTIIPGAPYRSPHRPSTTISPR